MGGLNTSVSGILAATRRNEVTANNVANLRTPGFQSQRAELNADANGGVRVASTSRDTASGSLQPTGRGLDAAPGRDAYFQVRRGDGSLGYTRAGAFSVNGDGQLTTANGDVVEPPVNVPPNATSVTIGEDGSVFATVPGDLAPQNVGRIETFTFANPQGLSSAGGGTFTPTGASGAAVSAESRITPGYLEQSNVDLAEEAVKQILDTNLLRANANAFRAQSDLLSDVLRLVD